MVRIPWPGFGFSFLLLILPTLGFAAESEKLADPLTLKIALQYASKPDQHQLLSAEERLRQAVAESSLTNADNDLSVNFSGHLRRVGPSDLGDPDEEDDSLYSLFVRKPLYDFGRTADTDTLTDMVIKLRELEKAYLIEQRELVITQKYFDVLNADNEYLRNNEDLAIGFIEWDRARERQELGLASQLEVIEKQAAYEVIRQNRFSSENLQRMTRELLADELGFPGQPPSEVVVPEMSSRTVISDDVGKMIEQAFRHSLLLRIQQQKLDIAMQGIEVAGHTSGPTLDAELEFSDYAREGVNRDDWRASIYFDMPLYKGAREKAAVQLAQARYREALSELQRVRSEIRVAVLRLWQEIRQNSLKLEGDLINQEFRDMALDQARAEYQLEFKADLGDSMVEYSNSRMLAYRTRFALEMAWRKLEKLVGKEFLNTMHPPGENNG